MNRATQRWCTWCGVPMVVLWLFGFVVFAGFVPLPDPQDDAAEVARMYRENLNGIRAGMILTVFGSAFLAPFIAVISVQMKRIEGPHSPLTYGQLALGAALPVVFIIPVMFFQAAAFRPNRPDQSFQDLNDVGWLMFIGVVSTAVVELVLIGACILRDTRIEPLFPRWVGYYNLWVAVLLIPGGVNVFFKHGPFAWNGLFSWWVPVVVFTSWLVVMTVSLLRAIDQAPAPAEVTTGVSTADVEALVERRVAELLAERGAAQVGQS